MRHRNVYVALINLSFPAIVKSTIISQLKASARVTDSECYPSSPWVQE